MGERRRKDQEYASIWRSVINFLKNNTNLSINGIARAGSRRLGNYRTDSDLDIIFSVANNSSKYDVYPKLVEKLKKGYPYASIKIGSSYNVIKFIKNELKIDLVLRTESQFRNQVQEFKLQTY